MKSVKTMLKGLTHEELREWAGDRIFDRGRNYVSCVSQLSRTEAGTLAAWVSGSDEYATTVRRDGRGDFDYDCTCPYDDGPCKHAVAVLLAAVGQLKGDRDIPLLDPYDDLALEMFGDPEDDEEWAGDEEPDVESSSPEPFKGGRPTSIESILADKSREELVSLLVGLASDFPDVARRISEAAQLEAGQVGKIVRALRKEIRSLTAEDAWYNPWKNEGNLPDYSHVEQQLRVLLDKGHADAVLELGEELWQRGNEQVECSHDEGDTAMEIAACLEIVLRALPSTSLSRTEQLQWLVDHQLDDEYDLLAGIDELLNGPFYGETEWSGLSGTLEARLENMELPRSGVFSETYQRERVMGWLCRAYRRSGRQEKVIPLLEREADRCRSYETLVKALLEAGESDRARQWCIRGFDRTIKDAPGIASALQKRLRQLAEEEGKPDLVAAYRAEDFFDQPSEKAYRKLHQAAEKVGSWPGVRCGVLDYLQTGQRPATGGMGKNRWPLPGIEVKTPAPGETFAQESFPNREMLIEIAILEQRHDDAVALFQELNKTRRWSWNIDEQLATAVAASHPDVALGIWKSIADRLIGQVKPKAYQEAARYLRHMRRVYGETNRLADWNTLIVSLRLEHKAKRRLMEVLDGLVKAGDL